MDSEYVHECNYKVCGMKGDKKTDGARKEERKENYHLSCLYLKQSNLLRLQREYKQNLVNFKIEHFSTLFTK
jgi:hypothetical protein